MPCRNVKGLKVLARRAALKEAYTLLSAPENATSMSFIIALISSSFVTSKKFSNDRPLVKAMHALRRLVNKAKVSGIMAGPQS